MDLFTSSAGLQPVPLPDGELWYMPQLPLPWTSAEVYQRLVAETAWKAESIVLFGRSHPQPRLTAWHGDRRYAYSGLMLEPAPWTPLLAAIRDAVQRETGRPFNSVLLNFYRNERDSMGMHSDDEAELGPQPAIASVTFGAERVFVMRHKRSGIVKKLPLGDGSLLLMAGTTQQFWLHGLNKSARPLGGRLNLTFRFIA